MFQIFKSFVNACKFELSFMRAINLEKSGQPDAAFNEFNKLLKVQPYNPYLRFELLMLGKKLQREVDLAMHPTKLAIIIANRRLNSISNFNLPVVVKPEVTLPVFYYKNELARRFWAENSNLTPPELADDVKDYIEYNRKVKNGEIKEVSRECSPEETKKIFTDWEQILKHEEVRRRKYGSY
jgi:hypothetical protein